MEGKNMISAFNEYDYSSNPARLIAMQALMVAIVSVATFIAVPGPSSSYFNLGEIAIYIVALTFGGKAGGVAGAFGSAITDVLLGYSIWAPFTFLIKGLEGYMVGRIAGGETDLKKVILAILIGGHIMIIGYGLTKGFLISWAAVLPEIIIDYGQMSIGAVVAIPISRQLVKHFKSE